MGRVRDKRSIALDAGVDDGDGDSVDATVGEEVAEGFGVPVGVGSSAVGPGNGRDA
jgi:hypothetical protein